jgi:2-dehydropantoate 2-reductase
VLILGTGAMACYLGARLARFGRAPVTLAGTWAAGLLALHDRGIRVTERGAEWTVSIGSTPLSGPFGPADVVLVLVKSYRTEAVAAIAGRVLLPSGLAITLQNGLGNREVLEAVAPGRVRVGIATIGATLLGPGRVRGFPGTIALGTETPTGDTTGRLVKLLGQSGFETEVTADIDRMVWRKLAVNCAINALSALVGKTNGALLESDEARATLLRAAREVGEVAAAKGIVLGLNPGALAIDVAEQTAANRSSMLQDLERGARTEIDSLNGAVVREGRALGVPTPINDFLWRRVREREGHPLPVPAVIP